MKNNRKKQNNHFYENNRGEESYRTLIPSDAGKIAREKIYPHIPDDHYLWLTFVSEKRKDCYTWLKHVYLQDLFGATKNLGVYEDISKEIKREDETQDVIVFGDYAYPWLELLIAIRDCYPKSPFSNEVVKEIADYMRENKRSVRVVIPRKNEYAPSFLLRIPKTKVIEERILSEYDANEIFNRINREKESLLFYQVFRIFSKYVREAYENEIRKRNLKKEFEINNIRALEFLFSEDGIKMNLYLEPYAYERDEFK